MNIVYLKMQKIIILLCFTTSFISFGQFESTLNQIKMYDKSEGLRIQNDFREYFDLEPYVEDSTLTREAQKWANYLSLIDDLEVSDDEYGELIFSIDKKYADSKGVSIFKEATIDWILSNGEEDNRTYLQIISEKATKIGVGFANSMSYYYVVAKYDSIY